MHTQLSTEQLTQIMHHFIKIVVHLLISCQLFRMAIMNQWGNILQSQIRIQHFKSEET